MSVTFKTEVAKGHYLHLNNVNASALLDALEVPRGDSLDGSLPARDLLVRCEKYSHANPSPGRKSINWKVDPKIGDVGEGVRRIRSLASRSKNGVITYS